MSRSSRAIRLSENRSDIAWLPLLLRQYSKPVEGACLRAGAGGERLLPPFCWDNELPAGGRLPNNNEIVIYELPIRWVDPGGGYARQVGLGTFDKAIFEHLDQTFAALPVNCIELLPVQVQRGAGCGRDLGLQPSGRGGRGTASVAVFPQPARG
jgi:hypothetical protein